MYIDTYPNKTLLIPSLDAWLEVGKSKRVTMTRLSRYIYSVLLKIYSKFHAT